MTGPAPQPAPAPIIVTALLGERDFAWADGLRRAHFPPERNHLRAHVTLFHHLPPSLAREIAARLRDAARSAPPRARLSGVMSLGRGTAFAIESADLESLRDDLADSFASVLIPQDRAPWRPHITVQNKVPPEAARALQAELRRDFTPRTLEIAGIACWYYRGGPWEPIGGWRFGSGHAMRGGSGGGT